MEKMFKKFSKKIFYQNQKLSLKERNGITLIALVVTIVVLLILAGVTITMVLGEDGIIAQAKLAAEKTKKAEEKQQEDLNNLLGELDNILNESTTLPTNPEPTLPKFNEEDITIGEAKNPETYGELVKGYSAGDIDKWRLFYKDDNYTYIIADTLGESITLNDKIDEYSNGTSVKTIGRKLNSLLETAGTFFTADNTKDNIRVVAWLTDPDKWKKYKNDDALYAIGGPTVELFAKSYNTGSYGHTITLGTNEKGYTENTSSDWFQTNQRNGIYRKSDSEFWWVASPGSNDIYNVLSVSDSGGYFGSNRIDNLYKIRPIVCFQTSVFEEKYGVLEVEIGEAINKDDYGKEVVGYSAGDINKWRLFYQDSNYAYIIADTLTTTKYQPNQQYADYKNGASVTNVGRKLNPMLETAGTFFKEDNVNDNIRAVAWLTDPDKWKQYKNDDALYAIGSPTIELFVKSYETGNYENTITLGTNESGYIENTSNNWFQTNQRNGIYRSSTNYYWWLASPGGGVASIRCVYDNFGKFETNLIGYSQSVRPLVCLLNSDFSKYNLQ